MKVLVAPNSMKGSLNAFNFADIVENAFRHCSEEFEIRKIPVADGGDYTGEVLSGNLNAKPISVIVKGPLGSAVQSKYSIAGKKAIIEMADASGMKLVETKNLNPMIASSFGTGQLILDAIGKGCDEILLAVGGSATVDGGMGMMEALGFRFLDEQGSVLTGNGKNLEKVKTIVVKNLPEGLAVNIICDVDNPLLGASGAAAVFGPQKGADNEMAGQLEKGLQNWAEIIKNVTGNDLKDVEGTGAAGGIAVPLVAFLKAEIVPGADFVLKQLNFEESVKWADLVITGEGKIDNQTLNNKAPFAVAKISKKFNKPVIAIGGEIEVGVESVFDGIYSLTNGPISLEAAMQNAGELLYNIAGQLAKTLLSVKNIYESN